MELKVSVTLEQTVSINPIHVITELRKSELGEGAVIKEKDKFYRVFTVPCGSHFDDAQEEITKELYDFVKSLEIIKKYLSEKKQ
jgi:hypothetical protein